MLQFGYHASLNGEFAGWQKPDYNDSSWKTLQKLDDSESGKGGKVSILEKVEISPYTEDIVPKNVLKFVQ